MYAAAVDLTPIRRRRPRPRWKAATRNLVFGCGSVVFLAIGLAQNVHGGAASRYEMVTVKAGDSLWSIAAPRYPDSDLRQKVDQIEQANHLQGAGVFVGESLRVPTS
ncbi:MAG TPA: LysM peptidoglycan-binding domain-containing protein [Candidatus Acidoferrales bacterium]|nr:LysM peptidoglycan-binding domain-containing protein [Candidatus Acidoferrales bacterium]